MVDHTKLKSPSNIKVDRFSFWPLGIFYIIGLGPIVAGEFWQQDDFTGLIIWAVGLLVALGLALVHLCRWRWKKLLSIASAPFAAAGMISLHLHAGLDAQWIKFQIMRPYYTWSVNGLSHKSFYWPEHGVFLGGGWNEALIYDITGKIENAPKEDEALAKYRGDDMVVRNMGSHFYLVTSSYGL